MSYDVIVVGGGFAGLSAAMQLARARRRVLMVDAGLPRNRFAAESHGFLGLDGVAPAEITAKGRSQLSAYPTFEHRQEVARSARREDEDFVIELWSGAEVRSTRLVLATGVKDELPLPGMQERWGTSVVHCPYCHGYELGDRPLGVIAAHPMSAHQALMLPDWGPTTFFTQGTFEPDAEIAAGLRSRGVTVEATPVVELMGPGRSLEAVRLADGRVSPMHGLFVAPRTSMASPLAEQLGCAFEEGPTGPYIATDAMKATSVPGVFAAGDASAPMHNATMASAAGVMAGVAAHKSLVDEIVQRAAA